MTAVRNDGARASMGFLVLAGAMSAFPSVTTDIYLPALPQLTESLNGVTAQGQQTLAMYFLGLGIGQLFYGPWSDRAGRKPTMLIGAVVYLLASFGCAVATNMEQMIALRFMQGVGACSGVVISAAIVRDRYEHQQAAGIFSMLLLARGLGPIVAPLIGGLIVTFAGWRAIFWALAVFAVGLGLSVLVGLPETRTAEVAARARAESPIKAYLTALKNTRILGYMLTNGANFACMFAWIAAAPYMLIGVYRIPALYFGWIFGINAAGFMIMSQVNRRLLRRHKADRLMCVGAAGCAIAATVLLVSASTGIGGALGVFVPLFFVVSSLGLVSTNAMAGGLSVDPTRAGSVSALFGICQYAMGGLATVAGAFVSHQTVFAMSAVIFVCAMLALVFPVRLMLGWKTAAAAG